MKLILRVQAFDGASATSGYNSGAAFVIKKQQPLVEYTHFRNHILILAIILACENHSVKKFMNNITSVCFFFEISTKRQKFLDFLLNTTQR